MISKKVEGAINRQMNLEAFSAYIYLSMAAYFDGLNLDGFSHWMRMQAREELGHAMRLYNYLLERDGTVELMPIEAPPATWESPLHACQHALEHERVNSKQINELMDLSFKESDHATRIFLQWFVAEQVEEEASATKLGEKVKLAGSDSAAILVLDQDLLKRQPEADE